jgi:hypothetical protein
MNQGKRKKLKRTGFRVGSVKEFLGLSAEEMAVIDAKVARVGVHKLARKSKPPEE